MGDNEELSVDQETVDQKVDQPEIGDEPQQQNSTDNFDPKKHTRVQTGANGELCFQGLTQAEVEVRIADGQVNAIQDSSNRSVKDIVMGNTLTFFNFINVVLLALVLSVRSYKNMLFIFIIIANTLIGIFQEIKAKITLDKLKILTVSHVDVIRDGVKKSVTVSELVKDDVILLKSGGQIPADGVILDGEVDVNESLLTGESDSIHKTCGSKVLSGSFVTSGKAMCLLTEVGHDCYMEKLSSEAKQFKRYKTELQRNLDTILKFISIIIVPLGIILFAKQYWISGSTYEQAALDTVAAVLGMIPEGLVLLTSVALALGAVRLARRSTLVRELFCIETLARVDTLCLDKTGTITEGHLCVQGEESVKEDIDLEQLMGRMVGALGDENETFQALRQHYKRNQSANTKFVLPFSSERKFSGVVFEGEGTYLMGAYQFIFPQADPAVLEKIAEYASQGLRVLTVAHSPNEMTDYTLAEGFEIVGFVFMTDVVRKNAPDILGYFEEQGVDLKVISGDDPVTVAAIAARAGLKDADKYIDATTIHTDEEMEDAILKYSVFGRVTPKQKQQMVRLLKQNGRTVAMTGDGVNDAPALKQADIGVAMGITGTEVAKDAAAMVLTDDNFATIVKAVENGRNLYQNIKYAIQFLLSGNFGAILAVLCASLAGLPVPFAPVHLLFINLLTDSLPAIALGVEPHSSEVMNEKPRSADESILTKDFLGKIGLEGFVIGVMTMIGFLTGYYQNGALLGSTYAFGTLCLARLFHGFNCKSDHPVIFTKRFFNNKWLQGAFALGSVLITAVLTVPGLHFLFKVETLNLMQLGCVYLYAFASLPIIQMLKWIRMKLRKRGER